ncbi:MAG: transposase [Planctomycetaceae bacterium]|nr:transposase [Planctomycetaceae bacterium]
MARSRYRIYENGYPHFVTCTVIGWRPVFMRPEAVEIVLDSLRFLQKERGLLLFGYVIMENHLHMIAKAENLSVRLQQFKSFTARAILDLLERRQAIGLLNELRALKKPHKLDSDHQFWDEGSHPQQIDSDEMMEQKLEYIHNNPVRRGYISDPTHWRYSSAGVYARLPGLLNVVTDWR